MNQTEIETALVQGFVVSHKRERMLALLANGKKRQKALDALFHFHDLDDRYVVAILPEQHTASCIAQVLRNHGAPERCWVVSSNQALDAREMLLDEALAAIVGFGEGSLISCVPGQLAFYEGEELKDRCILLRTGR